MPRKSRERERGQQHKESKRRRVDVAERAVGAQAPSDDAVAPAPDPVLLQIAAKIPAPDISTDTPYVIFSLKSAAEQAPPLPKGLPPVTAATTYRILATADQWLKIAPALLRQPDARIGVSGDVAISPKRPELIT